MKFNLDLVWPVPFECEADTREEAIEKAKAAHPNHHTYYIANNDTGESSSVVRCEFCEKPLFEDSKYSTDLENGIDFCEGCTPDDFDKYIAEGE